jgi:hypothetical protein
VTHPALASPLAVERYGALEPHLTDGITLAELACDGVGSGRKTRTTQLTSAGGDNITLDEVERVMI